MSIENIMCTICMDYIVGCQMIKCGHQFCNSCISEWLLRQKICPVCRIDVKRSRCVPMPMLDSIVKTIIIGKRDEEEISKWR